MIHTVRLYIEKYQLLDENRTVLVGLSGGTDSVALLGVLVRLGYSCVALHCNFHLRGEEADRDEDFAKKYAHSLSVPFHKVDFDTTGYAERHHVSIEMAARELRYDWFEKKRQELDAQAIAVAHHRDDSVETVLMNLIRGTGIRGMSGIRPKNGYIVRPLLCVSRAEIVRWLDDQGYDYMTDSTNLSDAYTRNFIRLNVLPLLEKINPSARNTIARSAEHLAAAETMYLFVLEQARKAVVLPDGSLSIEALFQFPAPETVLYELLKEYGFTRLVSDEVFASLRKESGKLFYSSSHRLLKDRKVLWIEPLKEKQEAEYEINGEEDFYDEPIRLQVSKKDYSSEFIIDKKKTIAYLDYGKLTFPLHLRRWKEGDVFVPFGMKGRKKLSDYFSDHKFSRIEKENAWILCSGDQIVWLVGERSDNRFRLEKTTKTVLIIERKD